MNSLEDMSMCIRTSASSYTRESITWKIDNFSTIAGGSRVLSSVFKSKVKSDNSNNSKQARDISFYLRMVPSHQFPHSTNHFIVIYLHSYHHNNISLRCRFAVIDSTGKHCLTQGSKSKLLAGSASPTNAHYSLLREHILDPESGLLKDGALTIFCEVEPIDDSFNIHHLQHVMTSKVLQDYGTLLASGKYADVVLVVGKESGAKKEFLAHKAILTTRSPVFGAMFEHACTKEAQESRVVITDAKPKVFEQFIRFVYTGKVIDLAKYAHQLLVVADKYQMDCLKTLCSHYLSSKLTNELVCPMLVFADMHNAGELKSNCADYIADHAEEVMAIRDWKLVTDRPELVVYLFQNHVKRFKK